MTIKISAKRPDDDLNGLLNIADEINKTPYEPRVAVVMFKRLRGVIEDEQDQDGINPTVRFLQIEPLTTDDAIAAGRKLMAEARAKRQGGDALFDVDGNTGEPEQAGAVAERVKDEWLDPNAKAGA